MEDIASTERTHIFPPRFECYAVQIKDKFYALKLQENEK